MNNRARAKELMVHYFSLIAREAGVNWDFDNDSEVRDIADCLIDAAKEEIKQEQAEAQAWEDEHNFGERKY